jgi:hypothetical protein
MERELRSKADPRNIPIAVVSGQDVSDSKLALAVNDMLTPIRRLPLLVDRLHALR